MEFSSEQIQTLIIAEITGDITDQEKSYLYNVISENEDARRMYEDMHKVLDDAAVVKSKNELESRIKLENLMVDSGHKRSQGMLRISLSVAAMVVGAFGIYLWSLKDSQTKLAPIKQEDVELVMADGKVIDLKKQDTTLRAGSIALNTKSNTLTYSAISETNAGKGIIKVPAGRFYNLVLSDGSRVMLNSATKLEFPFAFTGNSREIWIDGEAYLDVKRDESKPFVVHLPTSTVKVLGTSFNVNTYDAQERVSLVAGQVRFVTSKDSNTLAPGTEVTNEGGKPLSVTTFNQEEVLSWQNGIYIFHNNTLEEVAKVVSRWYGVQLIVSDKIRDKHFYGVVDRNQPILDFLEKLKIVNEVNYTIEKDRIYLK